jgi:hypothetical protein
MFWLRALNSRVSKFELKLICLLNMVSNLPADLKKDNKQIVRYRKSCRATRIHDLECTRPAQLLIVVPSFVCALACESNETAVPCMWRPVRVPAPTTLHLVPVKGTNVGPQFACGKKNEQTYLLVSTNFEHEHRQYHVLRKSYPKRKCPMSKSAKENMWKLNVKVLFSTCS